MTTATRPILMSDGGMVVSGHHRASEAGAAVLRAGGNAFDAAITAAATLAVAIPNMNGVGGDAIALCYHRESDQVFAINGSGRAPAAATVAEFRRRGLAEIPPRGPLAMSVCGVVHAWESVLDRFGTLPFSEALQPAIDLAETGVPLDVVLQTFFAGDVYRDLAARFPALADIYGAPGDRPLGQRIRQPRLADTLRALARDGSRALYQGEVGDSLVRDLEAAGALLTRADLAGHGTLVTPSLSVPLDGRRLHVAPPNSQGLALAYLAGLWGAHKARTGATGGPSVADYLRLKQVAFARRDALAADPARTPLKKSTLDDEPFDDLLDQAGARDTESRAGGGDTSTLVVVDRRGNAVSWVQSLFEEFGSCVVSPATGIVMHNRLYLEEISDHPVRGLLPGHRPFHTLSPALLIGDGCDLAIATPGDHGQPQTLFQVLMNLLERGMNIQQAIDAPRVRHDTGPEVMYENRCPPAWVEEIAASGFTPRDMGPWTRILGGVNAIQRGPEGVLFGGADRRRASYAVSE
ncbi:MAG: gamma-glutamyltransferase [Hyphomicrobiales bacterium]|nr:gamma-glutamyltransferase [Hyphomicrobiales bacterium]MCP5371287.1 gamma-glutamyltransferase [Hyphomicrobiales bacterium]